MHALAYITKEIRKRFCRTTLNAPVAQLSSKSNTVTYLECHKEYRVSVLDTENVAGIDSHNQYRTTVWVLPKPSPVPSEVETSQIPAHGAAHIQNSGKAIDRTPNIRYVLDKEASDGQRTSQHSSISNVARDGFTIVWGSSLKTGGSYCIFAFELLPPWAGWDPTRGIDFLLCAETRRIPGSTTLHSTAINLDWSVVHARIVAEGATSQTLTSDIEIVQHKIEAIEGSLSRLALNERRLSTSSVKTSPRSAATSLNAETSRGSPHDSSQAQENKISTSYNDVLELEDQLGVLRSRLSMFRPVTAFSYAIEGPVFHRPIDDSVLSKDPLSAHGADLVVSLDKTSSAINIQGTSMMSTDAAEEHRNPQTPSVSLREVHPNAVPTLQTEVSDGARSMSTVNSSEPSQGDSIVSADTDWGKYKLMNQIREQSSRDVYNPFKDYTDTDELEVPFLGGLDDWLSMCSDTTLRDTVQSARNDSLDADTIQPFLTMLSPSSIHQNRPDEAIEREADDMGDDTEMGTITQLETTSSDTQNDKEGKGQTMVEQFVESTKPKRPHKRTKTTFATRDVLLEQNRQAAARSRVKRKRNEQVEEQVLQEAIQTNTSLALTVTDLQVQVRAMRSLAAAHRDCAGNDVTVQPSQMDSDQGHERRRRFS